MTKPNILLIVADDLSPRHTSAYNPEGGFATPTLERLAGEGAVYRNAWASLTCVPTRVTMMTGWYGPRIGYSGTPTGSRFPPPDTFHDAGTFAHVMRGLGYTTAVCGKWHHTVPPEACGFDHHFIWPRYWNVERRWPRYWHPYLVEDGRVVATGPDDFGPDLCADWTTRFLASRRPAVVLHNEFLPHTEANQLYGQGEQIIPVPGEPRDRAGTLEDCVRYWDGILDRMTSGCQPNTLRLITSDNATECLGMGSLVREEGAKVVLIAHGAAVAPGERLQLVDCSDWYPTLIELAGGLSLVHDGQSFAPSLRDARRVGREWIYSWGGDADLVRTRNWLLDGNGTLWVWRGDRWSTPGAGSPIAELQRAEFEPIIADIRGV